MYSYVGDILVASYLNVAEVELYDAFIVLDIYGGSWYRYREGSGLAVIVCCCIAERGYYKEAEDLE